MTGQLFRVNAPELAARYLASFPEGSNPIFRTRTEHDCSCCRNFIKHIGNVVSINDGKVDTVWACEGLPEPYATVASALDAAVRDAPILGLFATKEGGYGSPSTREFNAQTGETRTWNHLYCKIPAAKRDSRAGSTIGKASNDVGVLRRGLTELKAEAIAQVLELIEAPQNPLYRGAEYKRSVQLFSELLGAFPRNGTEREQEIFIWSQLQNPSALFKNSVIGLLVENLSSGMDTETAVEKFEKMVAPENYKRSTAIISPGMIAKAVDQLRDLGLESAVERRFARATDVSVTNVLWVDNSVKPAMKGGLEGLLLSGTKPPEREAREGTAIGIADFMREIVPQATGLAVQLKNEHLAQFMSLTAPQHDDAGKLFRWNNGFAWAYDGDVTDSIKERVKRAGGNVAAALRFSLAWSNYDDLDIHVVQPDRRHIYFRDKAGRLDVDMNAGSGTTRAPVENVSYPDIEPGRYRIAVHNFQRRETSNVGFQLEVEHRGAVTQFRHDAALPDQRMLDCLTVDVAFDRCEIIVQAPGLVRGDIATEKWGLSTGQLVPVNMLLASPNHWDGQQIGNKHWFFILKDCINPDQARGFFNEYLRADLEPHRKVFEQLGAKTKCPPSREQLSGVGFSSTRQDKVTVVATGARMNRAFEIHF